MTFKPSIIACLAASCLCLQRYPYLRVVGPLAHRRMRRGVGWVCTSDYLPGTGFPPRELSECPHPPDQICTGV